ncbi:MAG: calcium-binding protein [Sterolibacterium sp.]|jgi:Ca2+-binding RTX toxin-like protein
MAYLTDFSTNGQKTVKLLATNLGIAATNDLVTAGAAAYAAGATDAQILDVLFANAVVQGKQPKLGSNYSDTAFVTQLLDNILGAVTVDATVKAGWVTTYAAELTAGITAGTYASRGAFAVYLNGVFLPATAPAAGTPEALVFAGLENRWEVSAAYAQSSSGASFTSMTQVTTPVATVTNDVASVATSIAGNAPVQSFTLTTSADTTLTGGAGNDSYTATIGTDALAANGSTLNAGDVLTGGTGATDALNLSIAGTASGAADKTTAAFTMTGVERLNLSNYQTLDTSNNVIDMSQSTGVTTIALTGSATSGDTSLTSLAAIATVEMGNGGGDLLIGYAAAAVVGTADAQTLTLKGQTTSEFQVNGIETLNIASDTSANTIAISDGTTRTIATINVTGSQNLTLTEGTNAPTAVTRIDASALTGKLTATTGSGAQNMSITGGTGNDTVTFSANTFTSGDSVDGGSGTDTLSIATAITTAATLANVTNVETLKITGANSVTLAANISATTFDTTDASVASTLTFNSGYTNATTASIDATDVVVNSSANAALTVNFTAADAVTVTGGTGTDTLNITADSGTVTFASKITAVDSITIVDGGDATATAGSDVILNLGAYATALTINASALDAANSGATNTTSENLTVDGATATVNLNITGGAGADSITGGTKNDTISTGDGNDTITMGANLTTNDTIDGGSGTDTLSVSSLAATGLTNVTNVENLALSGAASAATLASNLAFTTVSMTQDTNVAQTLTLATGYTNATTVSVDRGDKVVNSANVALTVTANALNMETAGLLVTITGGTGTDTLNITADGLTASTGIVDFTNITSVNTITIVDKGDSSTTAGGDIGLNLGSYGTALTIDAAAMDAADATLSGEFATAEVLTVTGTSVTKALTITVGAGGSTISTGTGAYNDVVTGGAGVDAITSGAGNDNYSLGAGADTINMSTFFDNNDTLAGGDGTDVLTLGATSTDTSYINVTSMNTLTSGATGLTHTLSTYANAAGITTINTFAGTATGTTTTVNATGMTSNLTINANAIATNNNDLLTGGSGNDNFKFSGTVGFESGDSVTGGTGTDTLTLTLGTTAGTTATITTTNVTTIENITVTTATTGVNLGNFVIWDGTFVGVTGATINAGGITSTGTAYIDASAETDSTLVITGGTGGGANTLYGGAGSDTITGGTVADTIRGGLGADIMAGGTGSDYFHYNGTGFETGSVSPAVVYYGGTVVAGTSVSTSGLDKITDFATGDRIDTNSTLAASSASNSVGSIWSAVSGYLKGTYDSTAATFTFSTSGTDSLFVYDFDGNTATSDLRGIVLVGYVDAGTADTSGTSLVAVA